MSFFVLRWHVARKAGQVPPAVFLSCTGLSGSANIPSGVKN